LIGLLLIAVPCTATAGPWEAYHGQSLQQYQVAVQGLARDGYRPVWVNAHNANGQDRYSSVWQQGDGRAWIARHRLSSHQYQELADALSFEGYRPVCVSGYEWQGEEHFACIWERRDGPTWVARHGLTSAEYQQDFGQLAGDGYRLVCVSGYAIGNDSRYAAIWERRGGPAWEARHDLTAARYQETFDHLARRGYQLKCVSAYTLQGIPRFAAVWEQSEDTGWLARHNLTSMAYQHTFEELAGFGYLPVCISGYTANGQDRYAAVWQRQDTP
jgi:hypothetical protein